MQDEYVNEINMLTRSIENYHEEKEKLVKTVEKDNNSKRRRKIFVSTNKDLIKEIKNNHSKIEVYLDQLMNISESPTGSQNTNLVSLASGQQSAVSSLPDIGIRQQVRNKIANRSQIGLLLYTINVMNEIIQKYSDINSLENLGEIIKNKYYGDSIQVDDNNLNSLLNSLLNRVLINLPSGDNIRNAFKSIDESDSAKAQMRQVYNISKSVASCEHKEFINAGGTCYVCGAPITENGEIEHKVPSVEFFLKFFKKTDTDTKSLNKRQDKFNEDTINIYKTINDIRPLDEEKDKIQHLYDICYEIYCECIGYIEKYYKDHEDKPYILSKLINFSMCHHLCNQVKNNISLLHRWKDYVKGEDDLNGSILLTYVNELANRIFLNRKPVRIAGLYGCEVPDRSRKDISAIKSHYVQRGTTIEDFKEIVLFNLSKQFLLMDVFVRKYKLEDSKNNKGSKMTQDEQSINDTVINPCMPGGEEFWHDYINYRLNNKYDKGINQEVGLNIGYNSIKYELKEKHKKRLRSGGSYEISSSNTGGGGVVRGGRKTRKKNKNKKKTKKKILKIKISKRKKTKKKYIK